MNDRRRSNLMASILQYENADYFNDPKYFGKTLAAYSVDEVEKALTELLQSDNSETVILACSYIRDLIIMSSQRFKICRLLRQSFYASGSEVVCELERLLFSPNYFIRRQAVYTLGKTTSTNSLTAFRNAVLHWKNKDPLILAKLLFEMAILDGRQSLSQYTAELAREKCFLLRWAAVGALRPFSTFLGDKVIDMAVQSVAALREDPVTLIRDEARYLWSEHSSNDTLPDKRHFFFEDLEILFSSHLRSISATRYTLEQLKSFLEAEGHKAVPGNNELA